MDEVERGMSQARWAKATSRSPDDFDADIADADEKSEKPPPSAQPRQQETDR
ncbi:MAG: hypothetical protein HQL40_13985 [Alphaproteobacteria bacterium]|nr:hypothetical protein [Alphaproteobacteria bacterium]